MDIAQESRRLIKECFKSAIIATIATNGQKGLWSTPVYFTFDDDLNIYFVSNRSTRHVANITSNPTVAVSVFHPVTSEDDPQVGVQMRGIAAEVPESKIEEIYASRARRIKGMTSFRRVDAETTMIKKHDGIFIGVRPISISYINTEIFKADIIEASYNENQDAGV